MLNHIIAPFLSGPYSEVGFIIKVKDSSSADYSVGDNSCFYMSGFSSFGYHTKFVTFSIFDRFGLLTISILNSDVLEGFL